MGYEEIAFGMARKNLKNPSAKKIAPCGRPIPQLDEHDLDHSFEEMNQKLEAYVAEVNLNHSEARTKILRVLAKKSHHFKAGDLIQWVSAEFPEVGQATIYRNIPVFIASGLIQEGPADRDGQIMYELSGHHHHDHIVCTTCGEVFEFHDASIEKSQDKVTRNLKFAPHAHKHVIYAACKY